MAAPLTLPGSLEAPVPGIPGTPAPGPMSVIPAPAGTVGMDTPNGPKFMPSAAPAPSTARTSGTVLSNANVIENTIPSLNQRANNYIPNPPTMLSTGGTDNPNPNQQTGQPQTPTNPDPTADPIYQQEMSLINGMMSSNDETSNAAVQSIIRNYEHLANDASQKQEGADAMVSNALLRGGTTRYAPGNAGSILTAQNHADIEEFSRLQDEENQKIAAVRQAQQSQNYNLLEKELTQLDSIRTQKQTAAKALADKMQTARDQQVQAGRDSAVANLVSQGVTDPKKLLMHLNFDATGRPIGNFTADEISKTLTAIQKNTGIQNLSSLSGATKNFFVLKAANQLPGDIASLPENEQLQAYIKGNYNDTHKAPTTPGVTPTTTKFTATQLNKGAVNAGMAVKDFNGLTSDDKNYFVNGYSHFTAALTAVQKGTHTIADLKTAIDAAPLSQPAKDILYKKANIPAATATDTAAPNQSSSTDWMGALGTGASDAVSYVRHLVGI